MQHGTVETDTRIDRRDTRRKRKLPHNSSHYYQKHSRIEEARSALLFGQVGKRTRRTCEVMS